MNDNIPHGYKKTEIGIIPGDWEVKRLGEVFKILITASYSRSELSKKGSCLYIHYGDIHTNFQHFIDVKKAELPTIDEYKTRNFPLVRNGDLIMVDASEDYEGIGKSVEVKNVNLRKIIAGLHTFLLRDKNQNFEDGYKGFIVNNKAVKNQIEKLATGLKVYGVSKQNLKDILIPLPPLSEQRAIEQVLYDFDNPIESLERIIAKKKAIKKGTMQKLLTGKKRLPGFSGKWVRKKMGEVAEITSGQSAPQGKKFFKGSTHPFVRVQHITLHNKLVEPDYITLEAVQKYKLKLFPKNSIILPKSGASIYQEKRALLPFECYVVSHLCVVLPSSKIDQKFLFYLLSIMKLAKSKGNDYPTLNLEELKEFKISFPPTLSEQRSIAKILSDMDAEIEALEQKKKKYEMMKKRAMELLLTGKIRIKEANNKIEAIK